MNITTDTTISNPWEYVFVVTMTSGSAKLQISDDSGVTFQDITDASWTASETGTIKLPACIIKPVVTGDATISLI